MKGSTAGEFPLDEQEADIVQRMARIYKGQRLFIARRTAFDYPWGDTRFYVTVGSGRDRPELIHVRQLPHPREQAMVHGFNGAATKFFRDYDRKRWLGRLKFWH